MHHSNDTTTAMATSKINTTQHAIRGPHSIEPGIIIESIFLCVLVLIILFGNILVCVAFYKNRKLRTTTNSFLVSLAIADIAVGSFSLPYWIYFRIENPSQRGVIYQIYITYDIMCGTASIINLVTISLERCLSVTLPAIHRNLTDTTIMLSIAVAWLYALVVGSLTHIKNSSGTWYPLFVSISSFFLPLFIILVNYVIIYRIAHRRARARRSRSLKREIRIAVTLGVVISAFIIAWLPFFVITLVSMYCKKCKVPYKIFIPLIKWMHYSGSMVNPIIYTYRNKDFRSAFHKILFDWRGDKALTHERLCNVGINGHKNSCDKCKRTNSMCNCPLESDSKENHEKERRTSCCVIDDNCLPKYKTKISSEKETQIAWNGQNNTLEDLDIHGCENKTESLQDIAVKNRVKQV